MRIFFRKHGNSLFYIFLPVFFLIVTVALIQFTPKSSKSDAGDECKDSSECCSTSTGACGPEEAQEACIKNGCVKTNVGCPDPDMRVEQENGECLCIGGVEPVQCIQCDVGEIPNPKDNGACAPICVDDEDPDVTGCLSLAGEEKQSIAGCGSLLGPDVAPNYSAFWFFAVAGLYPMIRRKFKK